MAHYSDVLLVCAAVFCATVLLVMPAAAVNTAIYGSAAGFDPALHPDTFAVACTVPGTDGAQLDSAISCFTNASTDVIILGGDAGFSQDSGAKIAAAVKSGKILVVSEKDLPRFADILPAKEAGKAPDSLAIVVANPNTTLSKDIFAGLSSRYPNTTALPSRDQYTIRDGATALLLFENGDPALAFVPYGNGYVAAWLPPADTAYLDSTTADAVNERMITHLMAMRVTTAATTAAATTAPAAANTTAAAAPAAGDSLGNVSVYSSPLNANVYIDGVYKGIAPVNLTGISAGSHALKLALDDHYDYDTTITVVGGGTITAFGSLAPRESAATATTTATPTAATTDTSSSIWSSPAVVAAFLGIITAIIGAIVTLFTIYHKHK
jgi:PEGA domain.